MDSYQRGRMDRDIGGKMGVGGRVDQGSTEDMEIWW